MATIQRTQLTAALVCLSLSGCCLIGPRSQSTELSASQLRSQELFAENQQLTAEGESIHQTVVGLDGERNMLMQQLGEMQTQLSTANSRIDNLMAERNTLKGQYSALLQDTTNDPLISSGPSTVAAAVPGFRFDELTGLTKFPENIHFDLGSAELRSESYSVLQEFANQAMSGSADGMRILVVGHTDDQIITGGMTKARHPTNWHLSTDRADQAILQLAEYGVPPERMASMGYSKYQPLDVDTNELTRQQNRRVELYLVPDSASLAVWDPVRSLN